MIQHKGLSVLRGRGKNKFQKLHTVHKKTIINWLYSKTLWEKSNSALDLQEVIKNLQCPTFISYLAALTNLVEVSTIEELKKDICKEIENRKVTRKNIRFIEKKLLIDKLGKDWFEKIAAGLIS